jgi:hypothetical protein
MNIIHTSLFMTEAVGCGVLLLVVVVVLALLWTYTGHRNDTATHL